MMTAEPTVSVRAVRCERACRWVLIFFFVWLTGRFWHPYYGFTALLQFDSSAESVMLPGLRGGPIYVHRDTGGYDGLYYAQLAASPGLRDPGLPEAIDNLGYRGRRILLSWIAALAGGGEPIAAVRAYAWLNIIGWFGTAALLWRLFPLGDRRGTLAWAGLMFAAGMLHSVRLALTDLTALGLVAGAVMLAARNRGRAAAALLGVAALARETALLSVVALLPVARAGSRDWVYSAGRCALAVLPLAVWLACLWYAVGWPEPGLGNFSQPFSGFIGKWHEALVALQRESDGPLAVATLLGVVAITVQILYLLLRPQWRDVWWRVGLMYGGLALCLGTAVWEGHPGAATRVLLPLALAFNVLAVRARAGIWWLLLGNLSVCSGVLALWRPPDNPRELATHWSWQQSYVVETDQNWWGMERLRKSRWAWCAQAGKLTVRVQPQAKTITVRLCVRSFQKPHLLEVRHVDRVVWSGQIDVREQWLELPPLPLPPGGLELALSSDTPPAKESAGPQARALGFACSGVRVD